MDENKVYQFARIHCYRLKIIGKKDGYIYSLVIAVSFSDLDSGVNVFPNPIISSVARINITAPIQEIAMWKLLNSNGQIGVSGTIH